MRHVAILASLALLAASATPSFADGDMKQSPSMFHKAGAACQTDHRGGRVGAGYGWRVGPCQTSGR